MIVPVQWASTPDDTFEGGFSGFDPRGVYTHFAHCILIEEVQAAAAVHKYSGEVKFVDDGVMDQWGRSAMTDTSGVGPAIEGDRTRGPWVELWGDWLHRIDVP